MVKWSKKEAILMKLNKNIVTVTKEIVSLTDWQVLASPMGGDSQWRDGRSAKELAKYITGHLPQMPKELEDLLSNFSRQDSSFDWSAESVTDFSKHGYGKGMGRNHDLIVYNQDVFLGIEAKADEPFGNKTIAEELKNASNNKKLRIEKLVDLVFGDQVENHLELRYQLLTACGGVLLEAKHRNIQKAVMLVLVFLKNGTDASERPYYLEENRARNNEDWESFLRQLHAAPCKNGCYKAKISAQCAGIDLYVQKIEIPVE